MTHTFMVGRVPHLVTRNSCLAAPPWVMVSAALSGAVYRPVPITIGSYRDMVGTGILRYDLAQKQDHSG